MNKKLLNMITGFLLAGSVFIFSPVLHAQENTEEEGDIETLSPFVVDASDESGYLATSTLAGTRIKTNLSDVGSAISVITNEFMEDIGTTDNESLLAYVVSSEVGGPRGNFSGGISSTNPREAELFGNPNGNTRIRGLSRADNTRNFFITDIPWDGYIVDRVDLQRGPNAILFGLGSPAGVINATTNKAVMDTFGKAELRFDEHASFRTSIDYNREIIEDQFAIRVAGLLDRQKFQQDPAFEDDDRFYIAATYRPDFMNSDRTRFELKASYENGSIEANRPRLIPPQDTFTGWWDPISTGGLGQTTLDYWTDNELLDTNIDSGLQGQGSIFIGTVQPFYNSNWIGNGGLVRTGVSSLGARTPDGEIINGDDITGNIYFSNQRRTGVVPSATRALRTNAPFALDGFYEDATLQDPSIFNFYDLLMDGPNKRSFRDWDAFEFEVTHTFFNDKLGYNFSYFYQDLEDFRYGVMGTPVASGYSVNIDFFERTPIVEDNNPDIGRAYITSEATGFVNGTGTAEREAFRFQAFVEHDFRDTFEGNIFGTLLGFHRLTGLYAEDGNKRDSRSGNLFNYGVDYYSNPNFYGPADTGMARPGITYYISDDLRGTSSPAGANLQRMTENIIPRGGTREFIYFDTTWIADPSVGFDDPWPGQPTRSDDTQAQNPANYRGWTTTSVDIISWLDEGTVPGTNFTSRDYLTTSGRLSDNDIESEVFVWQGYFWHDSIIGTYGYREDTSTNWQFRANFRQDNDPNTPGPRRVEDVRPQYYNFGVDGGTIDEVAVDTTNYSVAVHLHRLLGPSIQDKWPVNLSLYYNEGENFQPLAGRFDAFGDPLPPPGGSTEDISFLIATKDNRFSLRFTDYETNTTNQRTTGNISDLWRLQQTIFAPGRSKVNFDNGNWNTDNHPDPDRLVNTILPAWRQFELDLQSTFPKFVDAWVRGPWPPVDFSTNAGPPNGFTYTEDAVSTGHEIEFVANPTPNWRIAINGSKTEAIRDQVPGAAFLEVSEWVDDRIMNTPVGEMPVWWSASPGVRTNIYLPFRAQWLKLLALNGQPQPEVREWRWNVVTNYSFREGRLKGLGIGGAFRYEDEYAIDFPPTETEPGVIGPDLNNPFMADSEKSFDLWLSYAFNVTDDIRWRVQLNVYDVAADDELIPLNTDPFGNPQAVRISYGQTWAITNRIDF